MVSSPCLAFEEFKNQGEKVDLGEVVLHAGELDELMDHVELAHAPHPAPHRPYRHGLVLIADDHNDRQVAHALEGCGVGSSRWGDRGQSGPELGMVGSEAPDAGASARESQEENSLRVDLIVILGVGHSLQHVALV